MTHKMSKAKLVLFGLGITTATYINVMYLYKAYKYGWVVEIRVVHYGVN